MRGSKATVSLPGFEGRVGTIVGEFIGNGTREAPDIWKIKFDDELETRMFSSIFVTKVD